jgi:predicted adenine nucleotide alpha hydrolase (AANH) superfamily ATPase
VHPFEELTSAGHQPTGFWYNPNIHPYSEYKRRLDALKEFERASNLDVVYVDSYDLEEHLKRVMIDLERRCWHCFDLRLTKTVEYARENGFDAFTTTLLVSPYQNHEFIKDVGAKLEREHGVKFYGTDFTLGFRDGKQKAHDMGLYMQKYCGCVFSERERYEKKR